MSHTSTLSLNTKFSSTFPTFYNLPFLAKYQQNYYAVIIFNSFFLQISPFYRLKVPKYLTKTYFSTASSVQIWPLSHLYSLQNFKKTASFLVPTSTPGQVEIFTISI